MCMMCMMGHSMDHTAHPNPATQADNQEASLLEILKRRFALGEIDGAQFEEMKRVLGIQPVPEAASNHASHGHR